MDSRAVAKANFALGWMHVHIDILRRHGDEKNRRRMPSRLRETAIRLAKGVLDETIADGAAVEEEELILRHRLCQFGQTDQTDEGDLRIARFQRQIQFGKILRPRGQPARTRFGGRKFQNAAAIVNQLKRNMRVRNRQAEQRFADVAKFCSSGFEEFPTGRRVEKKITYLDDGSNVAGGCLRIAHLPAVIDDFVGNILIRGSAKQSGLRNRPDAGQRFSAKTHRADAKEIVIALQFAGGMGCEGQREFADGDSRAVVDDADKGAAAIFNFDGDMRSAGVEGILREFFHDGGWALDDLAGCDSVDEGWRQLPYGISCHEAIIAGMEITAKLQRVFS